MGNVSSVNDKVEAPVSTNRGKLVTSSLGSNSVASVASTILETNAVREILVEERRGI